MNKIEKLHLLEKEHDELGLALSDAECEYKMELSKQVLILKASNTPATLIDKIVLGIESVATKRRERDNCKVYYKGVDHRINNLKIEIKADENQRKIEWSNTKYGK